MDSLTNWVDGAPQTYQAILAADNSLVVSVKKVAELLNVSQCTVRNFTKKGFLFAPDTFGGRVLITKASLVKFLTEGPPVPPPTLESPPEPSVPPPPAQRKSKGFNLGALAGPRHRRTG